tara:strand:- start:3559 stop:4029 length:471 start_codon:yes stop_codon:yes gene_type:complete
MTIEDLLSQIRGYGGALGSYELSDLHQIQQSDISSAMNTMFGLAGDDMLDDSMFQTISPLSLSQTYGKSFSPLVEAGGQKYLQDLISQTSGIKAKKASGGFAGSGQHSQYQESARDVYGKGMGDVLSQAGKGRTQGIQNISDIVSSWRTLASEIAG